MLARGFWFDSFRIFGVPVVVLEVLAVTGKSVLNLQPGDPVISLNVFPCGPHAANVIDTVLYWNNICRVGFCSTMGDVAIFLRILYKTNYTLYALDIFSLIWPLSYKLILLMVMFTYSGAGRFTIGSCVRYMPTRGTLAHICFCFAL